MSNNSSKKDSIWLTELKNIIKENYLKFQEKNNLDNTFNNGERFLRSISMHDKFKDFGFSNLGDFIVWLTGCEKPFMYN